MNIPRYDWAMSRVKGQLATPVLLRLRTLGAKGSKKQLERHLKSLMLLRNNTCRLMGREYSRLFNIETHLLISEDGYQIIVLTVTIDYHIVSIYDISRCDIDGQTKIAEYILNVSSDARPWHSVGGFQFHGSKRVIYKSNQVLICVNLETGQFFETQLSCGGRVKGPFKFNKNNLMVIENYSSHIRQYDVGPATNERASDLRISHLWEPLPDPKCPVKIPNFVGEAVVNPIDSSTMVVRSGNTVYLYDISMLGGPGGFMCLRSMCQTPLEKNPYWDLEVHFTIFDPSWGLKYSPNGRLIAIYSQYRLLPVNQIQIHRANWLTRVKTYSNQGNFCGWYDNDHICIFESGKVSSLNIYNGQTNKLFQANPYHEQLLIHPTLPLIVTYRPDYDYEIGRSPLFELWSY